MVTERTRSTLSGWLMVPVLFAGLVVAVGTLITTVGRLEDSAVQADGVSIAIVILFVLPVVLIGVLAFEFFYVNTNGAKVLPLFGKYSGSDKRDGSHWAIPLLTKRHISLR